MVGEVRRRAPPTVPERSGTMRPTVPTVPPAFRLRSVAFCLRSVIVPSAAPP